MATTAGNAKTNRLGLELKDYKGAPSTLCAGCGHDAITNSIIKSMFELGIEPQRVAKLSGIGCSSKTPAYFLSQAHGINSLHGRMATIATGASLANHTMFNIGVSGDGDTASIGLGNFLHMVRRNVPIMYIIENNGCYGLTKGQFSATADIGSVKRGGKEVNKMEPIDLCAQAIQMGCGFVARSFSGDTQQVKTLIKAAMAHKGTSVLDIISPCVTFNNHEGSTKSVTYARKHEEHLQELDFIPSFEQITVEYDEGESVDVTMHDGSIFRLKKLDASHDHRDVSQAMQVLQEAKDQHHFYTGLLYYNPDSLPFDEEIDLVDEPLSTLPQERVRPGESAFEEIMNLYT